MISLSPASFITALIQIIKRRRQKRTDVSQSTYEMRMKKDRETTLAEHDKDSDDYRRWDHFYNEHVLCTRLRGAACRCRLTPMQSVALLVSAVRRQRYLLNQTLENLAEHQESLLFNLTSLSGVNQADIPKTTTDELRKRVLGTRHLLDDTRKLYIRSLDPALHQLAVDVYSLKSAEGPSETEYQASLDEFPDTVSFKDIPDQTPASPSRARWLTARNIIATTLILLPTTAVVLARRLNPPPAPLQPAKTTVAPAASNAAITKEDDEPEGQSTRQLPEGDFLLHYAPTPNAHVSLPVPKPPRALTQLNGCSQYAMFAAVEYFLADEELKEVTGFSLQGYLNTHIDSRIYPWNIAKSIDAGSLMLITSEVDGIPHCILIHGYSTDAAGDVKSWDIIDTEVTMHGRNTVSHRASSKPEIELYLFASARG